MDKTVGIVNLHIAGDQPMRRRRCFYRSGVTNDFDNDMRSPCPDIGADQVTSYTGANVLVTKTADAIAGEHPEPDRLHRDAH